MYLLDTNILSEFMRPYPSENVVMWFYQQKRYDLYVSVITQAELLRGAYLLDKGKRQANYLTQIKYMIDDGFAGRVLSFNPSCTDIYAQLYAKCKKQGRVMEDADAQIASIALVNGLILVTRNVKDFISIDDLEVINPFLDH